MNNNSAFSLIELMVVIGVVAILATVAVPTYKRYTTKTRLASVMTIIGNYVQIADHYYDDNSVYANALQAGLPTSADPTIGTASGLSPYLTTITIAPQATSNCPANKITSVVNTTNLGDGNITALVITQYSFRINNLFVHKCSYNPTVVNSDGADDYITGCINVNTDTAGATAIQTLVTQCVP